LKARRAAVASTSTSLVLARSLLLHLSPEVIMVLASVQGLLQWSPPLSPFKCVRNPKRQRAVSARISTDDSPPSTQEKKKSLPGSLLHLLIFNSVFNIRRKCMSKLELSGDSSHLLVGGTVILQVPSVVSRHNALTLVGWFFSESVIAHFSSLLKCLWVGFWF